MANRPAPALGLREGDLERLTRIVRSSSVPSGLAQRSRIVLLAAEGVANEAICERVGVARNTVLAWRRRYAERGLAGLADEPRSGRPRRIDHRGIVSTTLLAPPKKYGVTHWSSRLLGTHLGIGNKTVATAWREYGVAPWRAETFKFSTDPELVAKVSDVVGLYLAPPENAIWVFELTCWPRRCFPDWRSARRALTLNAIDAERAVVDSKCRARRVSADSGRLA